MSELARRFAWTAYDHLGGLVGYNLLWSAFSIPWIGGAYVLLQLGFAAGGFFLPAALLVAGVLVFGSPATVLLFVAGTAWARGWDLGLGEVLAAGRTFFWRALALGFCTTVATVLILVNMIFYQQLGGWLGVLLSGLMVWFLLLVGMVAAYVFPVLVTQEGSVWSTLRQSLLFAADNIKHSLVVLLAAGLFMGVGLASGLGLFCGALAAWALLVSIGFRALLPKYTGEALPVEGPRRLRELIRPWEA